MSRCDLRHTSLASHIGLTRAVSVTGLIDDAKVREGRVRTLAGAVASVFGAGESIVTRVEGPTAASLTVAPVEQGAGQAIVTSGIQALGLGIALMRTLLAKGIFTVRSKPRAVAIRIASTCGRCGVPGADTRTRGIAHVVQGAALTVVTGLATLWLPNAIAPHTSPHDAGQVIGIGAIAWLAQTSSRAIARIGLRARV